MTTAGGFARRAANGFSTELLKTFPPYARPNSIAFFAPFVKSAAPFAAGIYTGARGGNAFFDTEGMKFPPKSRERLTVFDTQAIIYTDI